jgi:hypothetical protein
MFQTQRAIFGQHVLMEPTALRSLMSTVLLDVCRYCSQFYYFENVCSFNNLRIAASLCPPVCAAPLVVCSVYISGTF